DDSESYNFYESDVISDDESEENESLLNDGATNPKQSKYSCDLCEKVYSGRSALHQHKKMHLGDETAWKRFLCFECGKRFMHRKELERHTLAHEKQKMKMMQPKVMKPRPTIACNLCGNTYKSKQALRYHMMSHLDTEEERRPFKCDECGRRFTTADYLPQHALTHLHDEEQRLPYKCDQCGKRFAQSGTFKSHINNKHLEDAEASRPFQCNECGLRFRTKSSYIRHGNTHL
ncbi:hypothetical protein PMAYCL1PPCAC_05483, partial [Pristionchus mayeri]